MADFEVDLGQLWTAIGTVKAEAARIETAMTTIAAQFTVVETAWSSPSSVSFTELRTWFDRTSTELTAVLDDMAARMTTAYWNYRNAEQDNTANVS